MIARVLESKAQPSRAGALILPWLRATSIGWTVGFILILILIAVSSVIGLGETQFAIGLGMGAGVGLLQAPIITAIQGNGRRWFIASAIGIATPFVVSDTLRLTTITMRYSLPVLIVCGGFVVGLLQWRLLRTRGRNSAWWIMASVLGWASAGSMVLVNDRLLPRIPGIVGALLYIGVVLLGGLLLGAIGGFTLSRIAGPDSVRI